MALLEVKNVVKRFGDFTAVKGISFHVNRGEIFALLGPNGAGKTTTTRMIVGALIPTSGDILIDGISIVRHPGAAKAKIGYMPQYYSLHDDLTVYENVALFASTYGIFDEQRILDVIDFVDLLPFKDRLVGHLSGGMKQRASLACAIIHDPELLLLDEPTAGVDPVVRRKMWEYFEELSNRGKGILVTTHYMDEASFADRIHIMRAGKTLIEGSLREIIEASGLPIIYRITVAEKPGDVPRDAQIHSIDGGYVVEIPVKGSAAHVIQFIQKMGSKIVDIDVQKPGLEDAFIALTGGKEIEQD